MADNYEITIDGKKVPDELLRSWEEAGISNDFIFCKVMQDKGLLSKLVRMILPDLIFVELHIHSQETVEIGMDIHGVRFDIFATDDNGSAIEIEMQVINTGALPKRMRFYGSMVDMQLLEKGISYDKLNESFVIMICPFDQYELGLHKYTFTYRCRENLDIEMEDGTTKIVLNADSEANDIDPELKAFLDYVAGKPSDGEYVSTLKEAVKKAKANKEWRKQYMTLMMRDLENQEIGKRNFIREMLERGKTPQEIADFCGIDITEVNEVADRMLLENAGMAKK